MPAPSESVAKVFTPTSIPTGRDFPGRPCSGTFSQERVTHHFPVEDLRTVQVLIVQRGFFLLQRRKSPDLIVQRLRNTIPFPGMFPMFQKMVVEPSALLQLPVQKSFLLASRIQPISEGFSHIVYCVQSSTKVNCTPYLRPQGRSFTAFSDKS